MGWARGRYEQALQICVEYNARYEQARTYHTLVVVAEEQREWEQARGYYEQALQIFVEYQDNRNCAIVLRSLRRLWRTNKDEQLLQKVSEITRMKREEVERFFEENNN